MGGVWEVYGTSMVPVSQHLTWLRGLCTKAMRKTTWGLGAFLRYRRRKTCMPQEPSSLGTNIRFALGKPHVPTVGEPIFLATRGYLPCHKRHSCVRVTRISQRAWHRVPCLFDEKTGVNTQFFNFPKSTRKRELGASAQISLHSGSHWVWGQIHKYTSTH